MNYVGISTFDAANGPGVRVSLFCSGCRLKCRGCFNPESWDFCAGKTYDEATEEKILSALEEPFVDGLSLLGGDPLEPENEPVLTALCRRVREKFGSSKTIWLWTGRKYEHVKDMEIFQYLDVVVDGPYIEKLKVSEPGSWFGSSNQRIISLQFSDSKAGKCARNCAAVEAK